MATPKKNYQVHTPTKEEQAQRVAAFLAQKKEQLFQGCLFSLLSNPKAVIVEKDALYAVEVAERVANEALKKMYNLEQKEGE